MVLNVCVQWKYKVASNGKTKKSTNMFISGNIQKATSETSGQPACGSVITYNLRVRGESSGLYQASHVHPLSNPPQQTGRLIHSVLI